jgi:hypothetical protein
MARTDQKTDLFPAILPGDSDPSRTKGEFCGFYGAMADANTFNKAFRLVLDRTEDKAIATKVFHRDMFDQQVMEADMRAVFTEYAWDMNWCDPCAADPLSHEELRSLGVFRLTETPPDFVPGRGPRPIMPPMGGGRDVFVTPMQARYDDRHFPETLVRSEITDRTARKLTDIHIHTNLRTAGAGNDGTRWQKFWTC